MLTKGLGVLVVLLLVVSGITYAHGRSADDALAKKDRALSVVQGQLAGAVKLADFTLHNDSATRVANVDLLAEAVRLRSVGHATAMPVLPALPIAAAPDTCKEWVTALAGRVDSLRSWGLVLTHRNDSLDLATALALQSANRETTRADGNAATIVSLRGDLQAARDTIATRPLPSATAAAKHYFLPGLSIDARANLDGATAFAGVRRRNVYAGYEQHLSFRTTGPPSAGSLVVGYRAEIHIL